MITATMMLIAASVIVITKVRVTSSVVARVLVMMEVIGIASRLKTTTFVRMATLRRSIRERILVASFIVIEAIATIERASSWLVPIIVAVFEESRTVTIVVVVTASVEV